MTIIRSLSATAAALAMLIAAGCGGGGGPSTQEKQQSAQATVSDFLSAMRQGNFSKACSLLVVESSSGNPTAPTDAQKAACSMTLAPRYAPALRSAQVGRVVDTLQRGDAESIVVSITGAPAARPNPQYGAPVFITLGPDLSSECGHDWCVIAPIPSGR